VFGERDAVVDLVPIEEAPSMPRRSTRFCLHRL